MGMYDEVIVNCPVCREEVAVQSKAGPCELITYRGNNVPASIAEDINGEYQDCTECKQSFQVEAQIIVILTTHT